MAPDPDPACDMAPLPRIRLMQMSGTRPRRMDGRPQAVGQVSAAPVAQLDRAHGYEQVNDWFESNGKR